MSTEDVFDPSTALHGLREWREREEEDERSVAGVGEKGEATTTATTTTPATRCEGAMEPRLASPRRRRPRGGIPLIIEAVRLCPSIAEAQWLTEDARRWNAKLQRIDSAAARAPIELVGSSSSSVPDTPAGDVDAPVGYRFVTVVLPTSATMGAKRPRSPDAANKDDFFQTAEPITTPTSVMMAPSMLGSPRTRPSSEPAAAANSDAISLSAPATIATASCLRRAGNSQRRRLVVPVASRIDLWATRLHPRVWSAPGVDCPFNTAPTDSPIRSGSVKVIVTS